MTSEHEAPTVARTTVWLDTSNDARTKRGERLLDPATALKSTPFEELATTPYRRAPQPDTATLDAQSALAAFAGVETYRLEHAPSLERLPSRAGLLRRHAPRLALLTACTGALLAAFLIGRYWATPRANAAQHELAVRARTAAAAPARSIAGPTPLPPPKPEAPAPAPDAVAAVDALARGDYDRALLLYRALAQRHPHDAAFAAIVKRLSARCRALSGEAACAG